MSLNHKFACVRISRRGLWSNRKQDQGMTTQLLLANAIDDESAVAALKSRFPDRAKQLMKTDYGVPNFYDPFVEISNEVNRVRRWLCNVRHREGAPPMIVSLHAMPMTGGWYLLPLAQKPAFETRLAEAKTRVKQLRDVTTMVVPAHNMTLLELYKKAAKDVLGEKYEEGDYPSPDQIEHIRIQEHWAPADTSSAWSENSPWGEEIKQQAILLQQESFQQAARAAVQCMIDRIEGLVTHFNNPSGLIFSDMVTKMSELCGLASAWGITDPDFLSRVAQTKQSVDSIDVNVLRSSAAMKAEVTATLNQMASHFGEIGKRSIMLE